MENLRFGIAATILFIVLSASASMTKTQPKGVPGPSFFERHKNAVLDQAGRALYERDAGMSGRHVAGQLSEIRALYDQGATRVYRDSTGKLVGVFPQGDSP